MIVMGKLPVPGRHTSTNLDNSRARATQPGKGYIALREALKSSG